MKHPRFDKDKSVRTIGGQGLVISPLEVGDLGDIMDPLEQLVGLLLLMDKILTTTEDRG